MFLRKCGPMPPGSRCGTFRPPGGGPALTALLGGHVDILFSVPIIAFGQIKSGDLRPLAVTSDKRLSAYPDVPTLKELGYDVEYYIWCGLFAPQATPKETIKSIAGSRAEGRGHPRIQNRDGEDEHAH